MHSLRLPIALIGLVVMSSCAKKAKNQTHGEYVAAVLSADAVPITRPLPTRPEGGSVEGKAQVTNPEDAEKRRLQNIVQPIVFGTSVGGITMTTPRSQVLKTLVYYLSSRGLDFFSAHIVVAWSQGSDPVPFQVGIQDGYAGKLKLPDPYGEVSLGQKMAGRFATIDDLRQFMLTIGASFEGQAVSAYDCEKSLTCQLNESDSFYTLDFRRGGIYLGKEAGLPISLVYFAQPQKFYAPLTDPILHDISIGGLNFQSKKSTAEVRIGPTIGEQVEGGLLFSYYDQGNFAVAWGNDGTPSAFKAIGRYRGTQDFGGAIGVHKIGDSFASYAVTDDDGSALMLALDRNLNNDQNRDCTKTMPITCQVVADTAVTPNRLLIVIDRSVYSFTADDKRTWLSVGMREP